MVDLGSSWTSERVELLTRLWSEGLSASQIAGMLGGGVTRNAVIGKVHRLGLSGRGKTAAAPAARAGRTARSAQIVAPPPDDLRSPEPRAGDPVAVAVSAPPANGLAELPVSERVTILDLRDSMCRWPIGDPARPGFGFCGGRAATGLPYCAEHCRIAYQPAAERKRLRA
jgi:GcrA cell cycle regulator